MHANAKIVFGVAFTHAATSLASMTVIPFDLDNRRDREVIIHIGYFRTEAEAQNAYVGESSKADWSISRIRLKAGEKHRATGGNWVKWCQVTPPSNLPCEVLDLRTNGAALILE